MRRSSGFTLIEMVVAIVLMSIISIGLVTFITDSASGYAVTAVRNQVSAAGRIVIDRMAMEIHNALPESVRVSTVRGTTVTNQYYAGDQCIEFLPVVRATTYLNATFRPAAANSNPFNVVDFVPALSPLPLMGHFAVIYPTSTSDLYKNTFTDTEAIVSVQVTDNTPGDGMYEVDPVGTHRFLRRSSVDRLYLVTQPVSYCVTGNKLYRYQNYGFSTMQLTPRNVDGSCTGTCLPATTPNRVLISDQLNNLALNGSGLQAFEQGAPTRLRNGMVQLELNFTRDGQTVRLNHEILQQMTP
jgi:MSHA biogenesis protein MshO